MFHVQVLSRMCSMPNGHRLVVEAVSMLRFLDFPAFRLCSPVLMLYFPNDYCTK